MNDEATAGAFVAERPRSDPALSSPSSRPTVCMCGQPLPMQLTGRPRVTCSTRCRRQRELLTRSLERRETWIQEWRAERGGGGYSTVAIDQQVWQLRSEVLELLTRLLGGGGTVARRGRAGDAAAGAVHDGHVSTRDIGRHADRAVIE